MMGTRTLVAVGFSLALLAGGSAGSAGPRDKGKTRVATYYVGDFLTKPGAQPGGEEVVDMSPMIDLIRSTAARNTWKEDGAPGGEAGGTITPFFLSSSLIIRQTDEGHNEVQNLLRGLRALPAMRRAKVPARQ